MVSPVEFWRDPCLPYVESRRAAGKGGRYRAHSLRAFSIGAIDRGTMAFTSGDGTTHLLKRGAVVVIAPERVFTCTPATDDPWSYQLLNVGQEWMRQGGRKPFDGQESVWDHAPIQIHRSQARYDQFSELNSILFSAARLELKAAALAAFVADLGAVEGDVVVHAPHYGAASSELHAVMSRLRGRLTNRPPLDELARLAGMDRYQLIRAFRTETGLTPLAWHTDQRIQEARLQVRSGRALAHVAASLGFSDQSHFQRVFKAYVGMTPIQYRS